MPRTPMGGTLRAVLLDIDGTLVDSNDAHADAWVRTLKEFGIDAPRDQVRRLIGKGGDKLLPQVSGIEKESDLGERISERRSEMFLAEYLPRLRPFPRARDLVARIRQDGLRVLVATSSKEEEVRAMLRVAGVEDFVEASASAGDADRSKPDPDIVRAVLEKGALDPAAAILIGDTPYDVEAAGRAGVSVIALRSGGWDDEGLAGAIAVYDDVANLLASYDDSPLAQSRRTVTR